MRRLCSRLRAISESFSVTAAWWIFPHCSEQPILRGIILRTRPAKLMPLYEMIWDKKRIFRNGAPLKAITLAGQRITRTTVCPKHLWYWAMRYQNPSIASVLEQMANDGVTDITVLPCTRNTR